MRLKQPSIWSQPAHPWTCSAWAPIHDPSTGELIGVVDLTSDLRTAHPHTLSLATLAAQAAEAKLRFDAIERRTRRRSRVASQTPHPRRRRADSAPAAAAQPAKSNASVLSLRLLGRGARARLDRHRRRRRHSPPHGSDPEIPDPSGDAHAGRFADLNECADVNGNGYTTRRNGGAAPGAQTAGTTRTATATSTASAPAAEETRPRRERGLRLLELLAVLAMNPGGLTAEELALAVYGELGRP